MKLKERDNTQELLQIKILTFEPNEKNGRLPFDECMHFEGGKEGKEGREKGGRRKVVD